MSRNFILFFLMRIIAITMLVLAIGFNLYNYYILLKWVVCFVSIYSVIKSLQLKKYIWIPVFSIITILFNPFFSIHLMHNIWLFIDILTAIVFIISLVFLSGNTKITINLQSFNKGLGIFFIVALVIIAYMLFIPGNYKDKNTIYTSVPTVIEPLVIAINEIYKDNHKQSVTIDNNISNQATIKSVISGQSDIGIIFRPLRSDEKSDLESKALAYDAIVMITNSANPLNSINNDLIKNIYTQKIKNWQKIINWNKPIMLFSQKQNTSPEELFENYSGLKNSNKLGDKISVNTHITSSDLECLGFVARFPGAIGFTFLSVAMDLKEKGVPVKILDLDDISPTKTNIINNKYPIPVNVNLIYKKDNASKIQKYLKEFFSVDGQEIIKQQKLILSN